MGFSRTALDWLRDCLKGRKQYANVNGFTSELNAVNCRIPQGFLLGPRLFSLYVNDLPDKIREGELDLYADDTTLFYIGPSVDTVCSALNRILVDINNWCKNNKLTIHSGTSEVMLITNNSFCGPLKPKLLENKILDYVDHSCCFGVIIDSQLSCNLRLTLFIKASAQK